jgi:hypothetical protein
MQTQSDNKLIYLLPADYANGKRSDKAKEDFAKRHHAHAKELGLGKESEYDKVELYISLVNALDEIE